VEEGTGSAVDGFAALPYPGRRPDHAYVQADGRVLELTRRTDHCWGLARRDGTLDGWLTGRGEAALPDRQPLLAYGSNACPGKLQDLRDRHGLTGPVVMTPCTLLDLAAAWCAGERLVDRSVPATLVAAAGREHHFLWWVAPEQWPALDRCEGRGERYDLVPVPAGPVLDDLGREVPDVRAYVGRSRQRKPMLDAHGHPLLVRRLGQHAARAALRAAAAGR
jgi:hypothetical protein